MAKKETEASAEPRTAAPSVACPQCGAPMVGRPVAERRAIVKAMVGGGSQPEYAANFADQAIEKEAREGVAYTCVACRYVMRVPSGASADAEHAA